jgi:L-ribulose-5-phosphate 3-epimerase
MQRRIFIQHTAWLAGAGLLAPYYLGKLKKRFKIGACDWSIGKNADIGAFELARRIGLQGIQVNLGTSENDLHVRQPAVQQQFLAESRRTGVKIASVAIGELNQVPYKSDPRTEQWVSDSIDVAVAFKVPVVLLAFFSKNDLRKDEAGKQEVVRRLKKVAPKAEKAGITLGIESYLSAEEHLEIMRQVGSPAIKVYYDFRNSADAGYDIYKELRLLGPDNICELHMKENRLLLGEGTIDWPRVAATLREIRYRGDNWMQIEWAMPDKADVEQAYKHNLAFLRKLGF